MLPFRVFLHSTHIDIIDMGMGFSERTARPVRLNLNQRHEGYVGNVGSGLAIIRESFSCPLFWGSPRKHAKTSSNSSKCSTIASVATHFSAMLVPKLSRRAISNQDASHSNRATPVLTNPSRRKRPKLFHFDSEEFGGTAQFVYAVYTVFD